MSLTGIIEKFSSFDRLVRAVSTLRHIAVAYHKNLPCKGWHICPEARDIDFVEKVKLYMFRKVLNEVYDKEIHLLSERKQLQRDSSFLNLDPKIDCDGILRVGGRLGNSKLFVSEKYPILLPGKHPISRLLKEHYHKHGVRHQGRLFTEGAVRAAGFWITGGKDWSLP